MDRDTVTITVDREDATFLLCFVEKVSEGTIGEAIEDYRANFNTGDPAETIGGGYRQSLAAPTNQYEYAATWRIHQIIVAALKGTEVAS